MHRLDAVDLRGTAMGKARNQSQQSSQVRTVQAGTGSHCWLPSMLHGPPQECTTSDTDYVIQEAFHVFLGACSGNVAGTAIHTLGRILGWLPGRQSHPCQLCPWSSQLGPSYAVPPAWESGWEVLGQGSSWGDVFPGMGSLCPYPPM